MASFITGVSTFDGTYAGTLTQGLVQNPSINNLGFRITVGKIPAFKMMSTDTQFLTEAIESCALTDKSGVTIKKKSLAPQEYGLRVSQCYKEFEGTVYFDAFQSSSAVGELSPELRELLLNKFLDTFIFDIGAHLFFDDTASVDSFFDKKDLVFKKLKTRTTTPSFVGDSLVTDAGAITNTDLTPANIEATMYRIYNAQSAWLESQPDGNKVLLVTNSIYKAYKRFLETKTGNNVILQYQFIKDGVTDIQFLGIPVVNMPAWDEVIRKKFTTGSPAVALNPHRAILTIPSTHEILIDPSGLESVANEWYEKKERTFYMEGSVYMDYENDYGNQTVIAGF